MVITSTRLPQTQPLLVGVGLHLSSLQPKIVDCCVLAFLLNSPLSSVARWLHWLWQGLLHHPPRHCWPSLPASARQCCDGFVIVVLLHFLLAIVVVVATTPAAAVKSRLHAVGIIATAASNCYLCRGPINPTAAYDTNRACVRSG